MRMRFKSINKKVTLERSKCKNNKIIYKKNKKYNKSIKKTFKSNSSLLRITVQTKIKYQLSKRLS